MNEDLIQSCYENLEKRSKTIRLLHLMRALHPEDSRIQCRLVTASLDNNPSYEALSYTWGECDDLNLCVWINGVLFPVRKNLWEALHGLKSGLEVERVLWIDALCINQLSIGERNHQVGLMGEIYHGAQAVLVWLGGGHSYTTTAGGLYATESFHSTFAFLKKAAEEARSINFQREEGLSEDVRKWSDCFVGDKEFRGHWQRLEYLLSTQYWKRLWIFQEITLARKICLIWCDSTCDWEDFDAIGRAMNHYPNITSVSGMTKFNFPLTAKTHQFMSMISVLRSRARRFSIIRDEILFSRQKLPIDWEWGEETFPLIRRPHPLILGDLLSACEGSYCQDPRDRIYGILGLLRYKTETSITVDYDRTIAELYEVVMEYFFQQGQPRNSIVRFSHHLQRAMLSPLSQSSPPLKMDICKCSAGCSKPTILLEGNITGYVAKLDSDTARLFKNFEHVETSFLSLGKNYPNCRILRRLRRLDPKCIARNLGPETRADPVSQNLLWYHVQGISVSQRQVSRYPTLFAGLIRRM